MGDLHLICALRKSVMPVCSSFSPPLFWVDSPKVAATLEGWRLDRRKARVIEEALPVIVFMVIVFGWA